MEENQKVKVLFGVLRLEDKHYNRLLYLMILLVMGYIAHLFTSSYIEANERIMKVLLEENKYLKEENKQLYKENNAVYKLVKTVADEEVEDNPQNQK